MVEVEGGEDEGAFEGWDVVGAGSGDWGLVGAVGVVEAEGVEAHDG